LATERGLRCGEPCARLVEAGARRRHVARRDDAEELPTSHTVAKRDGDAGDASRNERPYVCSATRLELHFGGDGDATRQRATLRGGKTDAGTLECLGREMHLVLVLAFAMACLFGVPTFFSVTVIAAAFVAGRGQQGE
jgi:hypothetical protein